ncbi:MAG: ArsR/SmtB family transcription factor [Acidobacteriota bacterium]
MDKIENTNNTERLARVLRVLGDSNRLGIVLAIGKEARSVTEIVNAAGLSQTLVSFHLRIMREADVLRTERNGPFIHYSLSDPALLEVLFELSRMINGKMVRIEKKIQPAVKRAAELKK